MVAVENPRGRILTPAEPWERCPKGKCRHGGHGTTMAKKVSSEAIQVRLWHDKLAGVVGTGVQPDRSSPRTSTIAWITSPVVVDLNY